MIFPLCVMDVFGGGVKRINYASTSGNYSYLAKRYSLFAFGGAMTGNLALRRSSYTMYRHERKQSDLAANTQNADVFPFAIKQIARFFEPISGVKKGIFAQEKSMGYEGMPQIRTA